MHNEKFEISRGTLSGYCSDIADQHDIKVDAINKLIPNLGSKGRFVLNYRNLQMYLLLGTKLNKDYRILKFQQSNCLKNYIDFNTDKRKNDINSFEKDFFKLMNCVYGKIMENLRKRVNNSGDYKKWASKFCFVGNI